MSKVYTRSMLLKRKANSLTVAGKNNLVTGEQSIIAFAEDISGDCKLPYTSPSIPLSAHELFGIFTADIIRTNVQFIR